jgi:DNA mismatch endonuclease (patch repair protein)
VTTLVPRFERFRPSSDEASLTKSRNRAINTKAELVLRRVLWKRGLRYRLHKRDLPGRPDLIFSAARVIIFVDGDFWHGRRWASRRERLLRGHNAAYWVPKIQANIRRDRRNTRKLTALGWHVIRVWETDVLKDTQAVADHVESALRSRMP